MDEIKTLILKLTAVINGAGCTDGEKENALRLRDNLLRKSGLKLEEIDPPAEKHTYWFKFETLFGRRLVSQILARLRDEQVPTIYTRRYYPHLTGLDMTPDEHEAVRIRYAALRKDLAKELELCYSAFVQTNQLGITPKDKDWKPTAAEIKELERLFTLAGLMNKTKIPETRRSRLISNTPDNKKGVDDESLEIS